MDRTGAILDSLSAIDSQLFDRLHAEITPEKTHDYLKAIADTPAPFQTVASSRGPVVERLLQAEGLLDDSSVTCDLNFKNSGNTVLLTGDPASARTIWLLAHLDTITYLTLPGSAERVELRPICYHLMQEGEQPAVAVEHDWEAGKPRVVARGHIRVESRAEPPVFLPDPPVELKPATRICFHSELSWDRATGEVSGSLDDAAGAAALLLAFRFLAPYGLDLILGLTDEEEGPAGTGSQSFSRGGARLAALLPPPALAIVSDIHEATSMYGGSGPSNFAIGEGASFAPYSSQGVGAVTPPSLYVLERQLAAELRQVGIRLNENVDGYVSRSEDINALRRTPNVALMGFLGANRHFERGPERANLNDLVDLAKAVVCLCLLTETEFWTVDDRG